MKRCIFVAMFLLLFSVPAAESWAGPRQGTVRPRAGSVVVFRSGAGNNGVVVRRYVQTGSPYYYQAPAYFHQPYYPPVVVISPYAQAYLLPPAVVVNAPFFCALHNEGFVSRVGLLDHLSGAPHRIPLDAAANLCTDGVGSCIFPSY